MPLTSASTRKRTAVAAKAPDRASPTPGSSAIKLRTCRGRWMPKASPSNPASPRAWYIDSRLVSPARFITLPSSTAPFWPTAISFVMPPTASDVPWIAAVAAPMLAGTVVFTWFRLWSSCVVSPKKVRTASPMSIAIYACPGAMPIMENSSVSLTLREMLGALCGKFSSTSRSG